MFSIDLAKEIWLRAVQEEIGLALTPKDPSLSSIRDIKAALYEARTELGLPELDKFTVALPQGEVWLVRNEVELE